MTSQDSLPQDHPSRLLKFRGNARLWEEQIVRRQKVIDRIKYVDGKWMWTGQAKSARGGKYPQFSISMGHGMQYLANARHVVFYLANGWVDPETQMYLAKDGDPLNVHPQNIVPSPPKVTAREKNNLWSVDRLRTYFG